MSDPSQPTMRAWLQAMRLRTLPLAASGVLVGNAIATNPQERYPFIFGMTLVTALLLQVLSNLANDLGDADNGADNAGRVGPARAVQSGAISRPRMIQAIYTTGSLAFGVGFALLAVAFSGNSAKGMGEFMVLLLTGIWAIYASVKYTAGKNPYGYKGLGDLAVFIFFGPVAVMGSAYLQQFSWQATQLLPAAAVGLLSAAVLNLNNLRDHVNDKASGKYTLVVRLGFDRGKVYHAALIAGAWISLATWMALENVQALQWLPLLPLVLLLPHLARVMKASEPAALDRELKVVALTTFACALTMFIVAATVA